MTENDSKNKIVQWLMNCKVSRPSILNGFCTVLDFTFIYTKFRQIFHIKFCAKCNWNFRGFLKIHITFYKHILNIINGDNVQQNYLSIEPLLNLLATFFVEKTRFLSIFFSNSEFRMRVYKGKLKLETKVSLFTHFWGYLHEKLIFWKKLN